MEKKKILDFKEEGLYHIHALAEELDATVIMASYSKHDDDYIAEITRKVKMEHITTEKVCELCDFYGIDYRAMYPCNTNTIES